MNPVTGTAVDLAAVLDARTTEGTLYERLGDGKVRCVACGHRCVIFPGRRGICQVRFNEGGTLRVPWGYVAALQCDPTEKKPFFHLVPGSKTLTFGMLGCDLHCPYCFTPETRVVTNRGILPLSEVFALGGAVLQTRTGQVARPRDLRAVTASGQLNPVVQVFRHRYTGKLVSIKPHYLPALRCTPEHRVFATLNPDRRPEETEAGRLTERHYLAVPRRYHFSSPQVVDVGKVPGLIVEGRTVRYSQEHRPGLPATIPMDEQFARLLGYYCANGSMATSGRRPNSHGLVFTFDRHEAGLADETRRLVASVLGLRASLLKRPTTLAVTVEGASAAMLFKSLCGAGATDKRVPEALFDAPRPAVEAFLDAYARGDAFRSRNGKVSTTTTSASLAYGVAWLCLKTGRLASVYEHSAATERSIAGRRVRQAPSQYTIVWYDNPGIRRRAVLTEDFYLIPIRSVTTAEYDGDVFNLEVEGEHNYLANFTLVANCQNWLTSQALRDPVAGTMPDDVTPEQLVALAHRHGARLVGSSYNEPLITAEWAVDVFRKAREAGLRTCFISNGNATREVLTFLRPWCDGYKIDLKTMNQKGYRQLGGVLDRVLDTIRMVFELGFWMEIVTLVIPGWNDSEEELRAAAEFIASVSPDIPWHVTAFHPDYKMQDYDATSASTLVRAARLGQAAGLRYVYAGNLPGRVGEFESTFCPNCRALLVERRGYHVPQNHLAATAGRCPRCGFQIPGIWA
ncbi:MAG: radical SAM protein [Armatimonadota bacterium]|nr:radical SAM protein [Armatimonadota bacterium]MDR7518620.1 radical SAM protein [Armatimonadota bacterium]